MALDDLFLLCVFIAAFCGFLIAGDVIARAIAKLWGK